MIPDNDYYIEEISDYTQIKQPLKTYALEFEKDNRIKGYKYSKEAIKQAIYLILRTERNKYEIYSGDYGIELEDLFGMDKGYVMAVLPSRIKDALTYDDRIEDVTDFEFKTHRGIISVKFRAVTNIGDIWNNMEVRI